jgi:two-component system, NtrC family, sensor histidine kinase HydH
VIEEARAISREVRRLDAIVTDFLRFARPRRLERKAVAVDELLRQTVELLQGKAAGGGVEFHLAVASPAPVVARCDGDAVRQVFWNVLLNAVEVSPQGGKVECEVRRQDGRVIVTIADSGPGVSPAVRRRAFDPFFSTKPRGTGLGLAVSKQVIDDHRGRIRLLSPKPGGTRVLIELPE